MPAITFTTRGALHKSTLRHANERLILNVVRRNPGISRADVVRGTGLSPSSVTLIVNRLRRDGFLREEKLEARQQIGRQPIGLRLCPRARLAIGVDVDFSGASLLVGDLEDRVIERRKIPWVDNLPRFFDNVHAGIRGLMTPMTPGALLGVGVTMPGFIDQATGKVLAAENYGWFGVEVGDGIQQDLQIPFYFENVAKASALAEMWMSERRGKPLRDFVFVAARGGLGTGVILNGQILQGTIAGASEFGHVSINPQGRRCPCRNVGCWEQYASDLAICRLYSERRQGGGQPVTAAAVIARARAGETVAREVVQEVAHSLALGFINLIMTLNPEAIVMGDYLAEGWDLMEKTVWELLRQRVPEYLLTGLRIGPSQQGPETTLLGSLALVMTRFFRSFEHRSERREGASVSMWSASDVKSAQGRDARRQTNEEH